MTTTEREELTMEERARRNRDDLEAMVQRLEKLRSLNHRNLCSDEALEEYEGELRDRPYGIGTTIIVEVELYGGGPAGGVHFHCDRGEHGLELIRAEVWHQDWFQPKGFSRLDDDVAEALFDLWGCEYAGGFQ